MTALMSIIMTVNVLAMSQVKQNEMVEWAFDLLSEFNNLVLTGILVYLYPIREIIVTIWNMFVPLAILSAIVGLVWSRWFSGGKVLRMRKNPTKEAPSSPSSPPPPPHHHHNLRPKRQTEFTEKVY